MGQLENCALLGYTASNGNFLLTLQEDLSVPSSGAGFLTTY